jgi:Putative Actinobacterial Holin-X, holin superfamily III
VAETDERSVGELIVEVSEKTTLLVREEIELAKAEISQKVNQLIRGGVTGIAAGIFLIGFLIMFMFGFAWLLNDLFFEGNPWAGFFVEGGLWLLVAGAAGLIAYRSFKQGAPPVPEMAIEEAKLTRETFSGGDATLGGDTTAVPETPAEAKE